jgi:uroporphyrinogen-III decarboxylase
MNSKERVRRAIEFTGPDRVPLLYFNKDKDLSDIVLLPFGRAATFHDPNPDVTEWGYAWEKIDGTMGQPKEHPIKSWEDFDRFVPPDPDAPGRFDHLPTLIGREKDRYLIGDLVITGFTVATFLRGFENTMEDMLLEPENFERLLDMVFEYESRIADQFVAHGVDAIYFGDDFGSQQSLMMSPELWRKYIKPRYQRQFERVHAAGKHVYFHCCGQISEILPDLVEIGCDVLNLNQPDIFGMEALSKYKGRVCFNCPVDHQTVAIHGTRDEIRAYVKCLHESLGSPEGGYIGYIEEYSSVGMSASNYEAIKEAFEDLKARRLA